MSSSNNPTQYSHRYLLYLSTLGIVYGDIGTSPLYAIREIFHHDNMLINTFNVFGVLSLVFWTLMFVISIKYMLFILRAHNNGEGGVLALMSLVCPPRSIKNNKLWLYSLLGVFGAALLYGDGILTPAISVLSAVEGLKIVTPIFTPYILPITVLILIFLFSFQKYGTSKIGTIFGPIMLVWFLTLGGLGLWQIIGEPNVLRAINPVYAVQFLIAEHWTAFLVLSSVFLVVTGGEALYADLGHFGRRSIQKIWFTFVWPCLVLNYFGQGALLLKNPEALENPFYLLAPEWAIFPLVILATSATIIASQAVISGVFSITRQAIQLNFCPRLRIVHTSSEEIGQIYVPFMNWLLLLATIWLVLTFKTSSQVAGAYGVAVSTTMVITSILAYLVWVKKWGWNIYLSATLLIFFLFIDLGFLFSNLSKIHEGGWFTLVLGTSIFTLMTTWQKGRKILAKRLKQKSVPWGPFLDEVDDKILARIPGVAVFMSGSSEGVPFSLLNNVGFNKILHEKVILLTVYTHDIPHMKAEKRIMVEDLGKGFYRLVVNYGFMESPNLRKAFQLANENGLVIDFDTVTFFLGSESLIPSQKPGMALWREHIFSFMSKNALKAHSFFDIPANQIIEIGVQIEL